MRLKISSAPDIVLSYAIINLFYQFKGSYWITNKV